MSIASNIRLVTLEVRNNGNAEASDVVVTEDLGDGHEYIWGSAAIGKVAVTPRGINPLIFRIGKIPAQTAMTVSYNTTIP